MFRLVVFLGILVIISCQSRNHEDKMPVTTHSETANVYYLNGVETGEKANMTQAMDDFGKAIEEDQDFFMAIKDFDSAARSYERAIGIDSLLNSAKEKAILAHALSADN